MSLPSNLERLTFDPPGPGSWLLDSVHVARPFSRFQAEIHPPNLAVGFRETARRYGFLLDTLDWRIVNGFAYFAVAPVADEEVPSRLAAAEAAFADKLWRQDMDRWERETKPAAIRAHLELQGVDPALLGREALLDHLDRCRDHQQRMIRQHHVFNAPAMVPVGDLIAHVRDWTDLPLGEVLALLRGAAPESAGSFAELDRLTAAIHASPSARTILESDRDAGEIIQALLSYGGDVGIAARAYLDLVGYRLLDTFDPAEPFALEVPDVIVNGVRRAVTEGAPASSAASAEEEERVRRSIPPANRDAFNELLGEARLTSRLRDERGLYSEVWAGGIVRRAILAGGVQLAAEGRLEQPEHMAEADYAEMRDLLQGLPGPSAADLAERRRLRVAGRVSQAPPFLGDSPQPPPPLDGLPPAAARMMGAVGAAIDALFGVGEVMSEATTVRGIGASPGVYTGIARRIDTPAEFGRLQTGDILVTATTTESFNIVLPMLGAIVTDSGGVLSHAAIVSREFGIASVVGCRDATARIPDGARVRVDGTAGEVSLLA